MVDNNVSEHAAFIYRKYFFVLLLPYSRFKVIFILKMEVAGSSETLVHIQ